MYATFNRPIPFVSRKKAFSKNLFYILFNPFSKLFIAYMTYGFLSMDYNPIIIICINLVAAIALLRVLGVYFLFYENIKRHSIRFLFDIMIILALIYHLKIMELTICYGFFIISLLILLIRRKHEYSSGLNYIRDTLIFYAIFEFVYINELYKIITIESLFIFTLPLIVVMIALRIYITKYLDIIYNFLSWLLFGIVIEGLTKKILPYILYLIKLALVKIQSFIMTPFGFVFSITFTITFSTINLKPELYPAIHESVWYEVFLSIGFSALFAMLCEAVYKLIKPIIDSLINSYNRWNIKINIICFIFYLASAIYISYLIINISFNLFLSIMLLPLDIILLYILFHIVNSIIHRYKPELGYKEY